MTYLLGVDVGTQTVKGALVNADGTVAATASTPHDVFHPHPGWMEHDAEEAWWGGFVDVVKTMLTTSEVDARNIAAVGVSGLFPVLCLTDAEGRPLRAAILYADSRATAEVDEIASLTGVTLKGDEVAPKLLWLQRNEHAIFQNTRLIFSAPGYVVYRLTGQYGIDAQTAFRMGGLVNDSRRAWRGEICEQLGISAGMLPPIHSPSDVIGRVTGTSAHATGLREGTPVLAGGTDTFATLLGNGVVERGEAMVYYGTTGLLTVCSEDLADVLAKPELIDDQTPFVLAAYLLDFGEVLEWFINQFSCGGRKAFGNTGDPYEDLEGGAAEILPGAAGVVAMPYFAGQLIPRANPHARGVFFGLRTDHTRYHLWRALLESFGYEIYHSVRDLERRGLSLSKVTASGGGAQSKLWRQIVSEVTGLPQTYIADGGTALGAAFLAGYGVGLFDNLKAIREQWLHVEDVTLPDDETHRTYRRLFRLYRDLDRGLAPHYRPLAEALT